MGSSKAAMNGTPRGSQSSRAAATSCTSNDMVHISKISNCSFSLVLPSLEAFGVLFSTMSMKVVLIGDGRVGKTSLVRRYSQGLFDPNQRSTIQAAYTTKRLVLGGRSATLNIWDTAGQERFHSLGSIYYRDADAAVLVFDVTDLASFDRVKAWIEELARCCNNPDICLTIAGNKCDLIKRRAVSTADAEAFALSVGARYAETSALTGAGVEEVFLGLAETLLDRRAAVGPVPDFAGAEAAQRKGLQLTDELPQSSGCCK
jgi:Ras-related protein Rab-21